MSIAITTTKAEKKNWLFRPLEKAACLCVIGAGIPALMWHNGESIEAVAAWAILANAIGGVFLFIAVWRLARAIESAERS